MYYLSLIMFMYINIYVYFFVTASVFASTLACHFKGKHISDEEKEQSNEKCIHARAIEQ